MMSRQSAFFILVLLLMAVTACAAEEPLSVRKTIVFAQDTMSNDFRRAQVFEVREALKQYPHISFRHTDARGQTSLLIHQLEQLVREGIDLLIIGTNDENAVVPAVTKAYRQGIPVIILDRGINSSNYSTFINSDNIMIGKIGAAYIAEQLAGKGTVLLFEGLPHADVTKLRSKGFLDEIGKHKDIRVVRKTGNYLRRDAIKAMEELLEENINIDAIFSESDSMLSGARLAMRKQGKDPRTIISIGCDYTSEAQQAIRDGTQTGSVLFPLGGTQAAEIALRLLNNETVEKHIVIPVKLITRENVDRVPPIF